VREVEYPCFTAELINHLKSNSIPSTDDSAKYQYTSTQHGQYS